MITLALLLGVDLASHSAVSKPPTGNRGPLGLQILIGDDFPNGSAPIKHTEVAGYLHVKPNWTVAAQFGLRPRPGRS